MAKANETSTSGFRLFTRAREVIVFSIVLATLFSGAIMSWVAVRDRLIGLEMKADRSQKVQRYLMLNSQHFGKVLEHVAQKREGSPPPVPPELRTAELELLP